METKGTVFYGRHHSQETILECLAWLAERVGRTIGKDESEVAMELMAQLKARGHPDALPAIATDGQGSYREAMVETWGRVPEYPGRGRPPTRRRAQPDWHCLQVVKHCSGSRLTGITIKVVYGDPEEVCNLLGEHTAMSSAPI